MKKPAKKKTDKKPKAPFRLEMVRAGDLKDNPSNWRRHPAGQVSALKNLIHDPAIGWAGAFLFNERTGHLIDGHARKGIVGPDEFVPVLIGAWTPEAEKKILATLDPSSRMAEADADALRALLEDVDLEGEDLADLAGTLDELLESAGGSEAKEGKTDPDAVPEPPKTAVSKRGEIYLLGEHRLMCGDSTKAEDVVRLMDSKMADCLVTDPPYGINYLATSEHLRNMGHLESDKSYPENFNEFAEWLDDLLSKAIERVRPGGCYYIWMGWNYLGVVEAAMRQRGHTPNHCIVWDRVMPRMTPYPQDFLPCAEFCLYGWKRGAKRINNNPPDAMRTSIWHVKRLEATDMKHPTQKPVMLAENSLIMSTQPNDLVLDICLGSGWCLLAAERTHRKCFAMEIEPRYVDVARRRWAEFIHGEGCDWQTLTPAERI